MIQFPGIAGVQQISLTFLRGVVCYALVLISLSNSSKVASAVELGPGKDQLWFISTRHLGWPGACSDGNHQLDVKWYDKPSRRWVRSSTAAFLQDEDAGEKPVTLFFVHGNRTDRATSFQTGMSSFRALTRHVVDRPRLRFVIFSWPSDRIRGLVKDVRVKSVRSDTDAYYLGWLLSQIDADRKVSLIGHSYGARVILGGLHLSAGGRLCGERLTFDPQRPISRVRVVTWAAGEHNHWLIPGHYHDHAYLRVNRMLNIYNSCDPALRRYRWVDPCTRSEAMGYTGVAGRWRLQGGGKRIDQLDACCTIGNTHSVCSYYNSPDIIHTMRPYVFWAKDRSQPN